MEDEIAHRRSREMWLLTSLGPRPSPLRDLLRAFNCAGEGNIENVEGRPGMKHHVPIDVGYYQTPGRARPVASTTTINVYTRERLTHVRYA